MIESSNPTFQVFYAGTKAPDNLSNSLDLVELGLQLVDLVEDVAEACDFVVGHLDGVTRSIVLRLRRPFGGLVELEGRQMC